MAAAARDSEISQASYSAKSVVELLDQFKEAANRSVLSSCFVSVICNDTPGLIVRWEKLSEALSSC